jgi:ketosteroid isomerase-like protein
MTQTHPTTAATRAVLRGYLDALVAGDVDTIAASFAEDATWSLHGTLPLAGVRHGRQDILRFLLGAVSLYQPGTQTFDFGDITAEHDRAVLEWRVRGIAAATGKAYDNEYCGVFVIRDGHITEVREYLDTQHAADTLYNHVPTESPRP